MAPPLAPWLTSLPAQWENRFSAEPLEGWALEERHGPKSDGGCAAGPARGGECPTHRHVQAELIGELNSIRPNGPPGGDSTPAVCAVINATLRGLPRRDYRMVQEKRVNRGVGKHALRISLFSAWVLSKHEMQLKECHAATEIQARASCDL